MSTIDWSSVLLAQAGPGGGMMQWTPMILILGVFYFLLIRPQQKQAKEHQDFVGGLKRGDWVVTSGGLYGKVTEVRDTDVTLEIGEGSSAVRVRHQRDKLGGYDPGKKSSKSVEGKRKEN